MVSVETIGKIRRAWHVQGKSIRSIAKSMGVRATRFARCCAPGRRRRSTGVRTSLIRSSVTSLWSVERKLENNKEKKRRDRLSMKRDLGAACGPTPSHQTAIQIDALYDHLLRAAGNPALMSADLKTALTAHGNPRSLAIMADSLLAAAARKPSARNSTKASSSRSSEPPCRAGGHADDRIPHTQAARTRGPPPPAGLAGRHPVGRTGRRHPRGRTQMRQDLPRPRHRRRRRQCRPLPAALPGRTLPVQGKPPVLRRPPSPPSSPASKSSTTPARAAQHGQDRRCAAPGNSSHGATAWPTCAGAVSRSS